MITIKAGDDLSRIDAECKEKYPLVFESSTLMVCKADINGYEFEFAFDEDNKIERIITREEQYQVNGLGVGSTFGQIKEKYPEPFIFSYQAVVNNGKIKFGFNPPARKKDRRHIDDSEKVTYVVLDEIQIY